MAKQLLEFYTSEYKCSDLSCPVVTRQLSLGDKCVISVCRGILRPRITEKDVCNTFSYLYALFDQQGKYIGENGRLTKQSSADDEFYVRVLCQHIEGLKQRNSYDKVELGKVFDFMNAFNC